MSKKKETDQQLDLQKKKEEPKKGKVISEEVPDHITLKDSKSGQTVRSRYKDEVESQLTKEKSDVSSKDLSKEVSIKKETDQQLDLQKKKEEPKKAMSTQNSAANHQKKCEGLKEDEALGPHQVVTPRKVSPDIFHVF